MPERNGNGGLCHLHVERGRRHPSIRQPTHSRSLRRLRLDSATRTGCVAYCEDTAAHKVLRETLQRTSAGMSQGGSPLGPGC